MPNNLRAKCIIVGDDSVGKSAVTQVFHSDNSHFPKNYSMTTGVELCIKSVTVPESRESVEMLLYDTGGKEIFSAHTSKYWVNPSVFIIVFDITDNNSFNSSAKWLERVRSQKPKVQVPGVLLGNKTDLDQRRVVSWKEANEFAEANGLTYFECSAKEMHKVDDPFRFLASSYLELYQQKIQQFKSIVI